MMKREWDLLFSEDDLRVVLDAQRAKVNDERTVYLVFSLINNCHGSHPTPVRDWSRLRVGHGRWSKGIGEQSEKGSEMCVAGL